MSIESYPTDKLSDAQIVGLLNIGLESEQQSREVWVYFGELAEMPFRQLFAKLRELLHAQGLDELDIARLLGVSELTVRRWVSTSKPLADFVKERLAGLCFLLSYTGLDSCGPEIKNLVHRALFPDSSDVLPGESSAIFLSLNHVFGCSGLMAVAMYLALSEKDSEPVGGNDDP